MANWISGATVTGVEDTAAWIVLVLASAFVLGSSAAVVDFMLGCAASRLYRAPRRVCVRFTPTWKNRDAFGPAWDQVQCGPAHRRRE